MSVSQLDQPGDVCLRRKHARALWRVRRPLRAGDADGGVCWSWMRRMRRSAKRSEAFHAELNGLLKDYVGRPTPLYFARRLTETLGGAKIYSQARRPVAYRRAQDQQRAGAGTPGAADGQAADYRGDRRRDSMAWRQQRCARCLGWSAWSTWAKKTCGGRS